MAVNTAPTRKRPASNHEMDVSEIVQCKNATVHGLVVGAISPVRTSKKNSEIKFFESQLCDGKEVVRVISFNPHLRQDFTKFKELNEEIILADCTVQASKITQNLEILANSKTKISKSPKKFKLDDSLQITTTSTRSDMDVTVSDLKDLAVNQRINVIAKVILVQPPMNIQSTNGTVLLKQDCTIANSS